MLRQRCTRRRKDGRQCERDASDWSSAAGDGVVSCWTHLSASERQRCEEAKQASTPPRRQPAPRPQCTGGPCISIARASDWRDDHPDSAYMICNTCNADIRTSCGRRPVEVSPGICDSCGALMAEADTLIDPSAQAGGSPWDLRRELNRLVAQIVRAGDLTYPSVQNRMNQVMGVRQRERADTEQLNDGVDYAERWLRQLSQAQEQRGSERDKWRRELQQWATSRGLTPAQVVELIQEPAPPPPP